MPDHQAEGGEPGPVTAIAVTQRQLRLILSALLHQLHQHTPPDGLSGELVELVELIAKLGDIWDRNYQSERRSRAQKVQW